MWVTFAVQRPTSRQEGVSLLHGPVVFVIDQVGRVPHEIRGSRGVEVGHERQGIGDRHMGGGEVLPREMAHGVLPGVIPWIGRQILGICLLGDPSDRQLIGQGRDSREGVRRRGVVVGHPLVGARDEVQVVGKRRVAEGIALRGQTVGVRQQVGIGLRCLPDDRAVVLVLHHDDHDVRCRGVRWHGGLRRRARCGSGAACPWRRYGMLGRQRSATARAQSDRKDGRAERHSHHTHSRSQASPAGRQPKIVRQTPARNQHVSGGQQLMAWWP